MKRLVLLAVTAGVLALTSVALAGPSLLGKWKETIKNDSADHGQLNGTWVVSLTSGHYKATDNGQLVVKGKDTIRGSVISLTDTSGPGKCSGTGKYKFKISANKLKFTLVSDSSASCAGRKGVLTHGAFSEDTGSGLVGGY